MDRQDIDALLIGALYGELTPADEARLAAHLDSHPTDRGALDDLKSARNAVRESRIFELQVDPPQAVSALLLQEAHRRAPKRAPEREHEGNEGWFYRFSRMFLAHPAMAAAAMLVLVVGVAGTLYMKKGSDQFVDKQAEPPALQEKADTVAVEAPAMDPAAANEGVGAADTGIAQGSGSSFGYQVQLADGKAEAKQQASDRAEQVAKLKDQQNALERQQELAVAKNKRAASSSIIVDTPQREPKELDEPRAKVASKVGAKKGNVQGGEDAEIATDSFDSNRGRGDTAATGSTVARAGAGGGGTVGGATGTGAPGGRVATTPPAAAGPARNAPTPAPPPPPAATTAPAPAQVAQQQPKSPTATAKPTTPPAKVAKEAEKTESKPDSTAGKDSALIAWAKGQHSQAQSLAGKGDCAGAAKVAVLISNRAPEFYSQYVATDRALKKCQAYIAAERDADAERSGKARSQKRVNADQPAEAAH
ncbi:MAG TPA: hypothetical protein VFV99_30095 [Kofleriaceae bacterium]|nr:hypothetical protein [Kofleriaceae bacterium]